ncbi:MAG TPA: hypothetical protein VHI52_04565, partial [Verrucomicrobiae bacterium]|nr:hypothetical protein [Verrucomicrobiae bacterium]
RDLASLARLLCRALFRRTRPTGSCKQIPFSAGNHDARSATRRLLVVLGGSTPPNSIVLAVDQHNQSLTVHQLASSSEVSQDREWPL